MYESARATVIHGEALAVLTTLPDAHVDAVITDPPYSSGGQYRGDRAGDPLTKYVTSASSARNLATFGGDNRDQRAYLTWCALWLSEALRVARPGAALCVFCDWRQLPVTTDAVQAGGWTWRGIVVWRKPNHRPQLGRFSAVCEYIVWATAGHRPTDYPAETLQGFVVASAPAHRDHPTEKPLAVMRYLTRIAPPDGLVLDPFAGSGTTAAAALMESRRALAIEISDHYAGHTADRLRKIETTTPTATTGPDLWGTTGETP
jgi:site-specific DNA-methyltransferase (adenine-specific)